MTRHFDYHESIIQGHTSRNPGLDSPTKKKTMTNDSRKCRKTHSRPSFLKLQFISKYFLKLFFFAKPKHVLHNLWQKLSQTKKIMSKKKLCQSTRIDTTMIAPKQKTKTK